MIENIGDILAIPFFAWASLYFHKMENKTREEWVLYIFSVVGFLVDSIFTARFLTRVGGYKLQLFAVAYLGIFLYHIIV